MKTANEQKKKTAVDFDGESKYYPPDDACKNTDKWDVWVESHFSGHGNRSYCSIEMEYGGKVIKSHQMSIPGFPDRKTALKTAIDVCRQLKAVIGIRLSGGPYKEPGEPYKWKEFPGEDNINMWEKLLPPLLQGIPCNIIDLTYPIGIHRYENGNGLDMRRLHEATVKNPEYMEMLADYILSACNTGTEAWEGAKVFDVSRGWAILYSDANDTYAIAQAKLPPDHGYGVINYAHFDNDD